MMSVCLDLSNNTGGKFVISFCNHHMEKFCVKIKFLSAWAKTENIFQVSGKQELYIPFNPGAWNYSRNCVKMVAKYIGQWHW